MNKRETREILATHADQLVGLRASPDRRLTRSDQVQALLDLAEQLQGILVRVEPRAHYRRRLHGELILEAQRRQAEANTSPGRGGVRVQAPSLLQQHRKGILIGAAAVGSAASVAGVIVAFVWRLRHGGATHTATG